MYVRNLSLDLLKIIMTFLVVIGHTQTPFTAVIFSFHMPMFFMISGLFISKNTRLLLRIKKDMKRLLIPFFIFSILGLLTESGKRLLLNRSFGDFGQVLSDAYLWINSGAYYYGFVLWFFPALFWGKIIVQALINIKCEKYFFILLMIGFLTTDNISQILNLFPFGMGQGLVATIFLIIGYKFMQLPPNFKKIVFTFSLLYTIFFIVSTHKLPHLDLGSNLISNHWYNILWSISFCLTFIYVFSELFTINNSKIVNSLCLSNLLIFSLHPYTNNISYLINNIFIHGEWFFVVIISIVLLLPIIFIRIRYPKLSIFKYV